MLIEDSRVPAQAPSCSHRRPLAPFRHVNRDESFDYHFLAKILQDLTSKKLLISQKGPTGGAAPAHSAEEVIHLQIVEAVDGAGLPTACVLGFPECSNENPYAVHGRWAGVRDEIHAMHEGKRVAQPARGMGKPQYRNSRVGTARR